MSNITVVVGGQYGSEAKGHITAQLTREALLNKWDAMVIRVAGPNAGHTAYNDKHEKFAFRQVPVGMVVNDEFPDGSGLVTGVIAAGSEIDLPVLIDEILQLRNAGIPYRLYVDVNATMIYDGHKEAEAQADLVGKLGSTGKGIGAARADRIMRRGKRLLDDHDAIIALTGVGAIVCDTADVIRAALSEKRTHVIVEGTQGYGLGLHTAAYPKVTSSDCRAVDFLAMAGISPWHQGVAGVQVVVVARVFPIRVAGDSGPMKGETTWDELGLEAERTTVTQKVRRVGEWDAELVHNAVRANGGGGLVRNPYADMLPEPVVLVLTMVDQIIPGVAGATSLSELGLVVRDQLEELVALRSAEAGAPIQMVGTGPETVIWL